MSSVADDLREALIDAYPSYVESRIRDQQLRIPPTLPDALEEGVSWLRSTLEDLLGRPYALQRRGPLEVFQAAVRFPTQALSAAGAEPVNRDNGAVAALPGDLFNLAPASSRQIGEAVWLAHLAWGADKARQVRESRRAMLLADNLMDRTRIETVIAGLGYELCTWKRLDVQEPLPDLVLVDLEHEDAIAAVASYAGVGARVVAFGPHADRNLLDQAGRAGAEVNVRSVFFADLGRFLT